MTLKEHEQSEFEKQLAERLERIQKSNLPKDSFKQAKETPFKEGKKE